MSMEAVVEYEYQAEQEDELTLKVGDIITNVTTAEGGWWEGELNGKKGMFPENFVKLVKRRETAISKKEEKREATQRKSVRELANKFKDGVPMGVAPKKKDKKKKCKVLFEYKRENDDELDLQVGELVEFHKQVEEGWWEGSLNGKHGVFPSNFVEMIEEQGSSDESAPATVEDKEKDKVQDTQPKSDDAFQTIKGKKVVGVGLGNIFGGGPIKLRPTAESGKKEDGTKSGKSGDSGESAPEVAKREKQSTFERAVVRFSYTAEQPDELTLIEGQIVRILDKELEDEGWWKGEVGGKVGVFPDNFVELLPNEEVIHILFISFETFPISSGTPRSPSKDSQYLGKRAQIAKELSKSSTPSITKKPVAPPPIGKKPFNQKSVEPKSEPSIPMKTPSLIKDKSANREIHSDERNTDESGSFDGIEPAGQKLTHLTANRAKGPKKRPPSTVLTLNDGEKDSESLDESKNSYSAADKINSHVSEKHHSHLPDRPDKPHPILPPKDNKHQPQPPSEPEPPSLPPPQLLHTMNRDQSPHISAPPPRPPEPASNKALITNTSNASNLQVNKLIEQLQREINELKANSVSKAAYNDLRAEHEKLKSEFESMRNAHSKKFRELENEVDEEKKLRLTTQVEIERVKKFMSETNV
ncbi:unnamed protein product [Lymnaea stagnalis]|uniref:SH3 domain-containing protein n=1 Tax=Lymnaea stagnalis TaxID=6523 RepID=A0AAV2IIE4_LYMST